MGLVLPNYSKNRETSPRPLPLLISSPASDGTKSLSVSLMQADLANFSVSFFCRREKTNLSLLGSFEGLAALV